MGCMGYRVSSRGVEECSILFRRLYICMREEYIALLRYWHIGVLLCECEGGYV